MHGAVQAIIAFSVPTSAPSIFKAFLHGGFCFSYISHEKLISLREYASNAASAKLHAFEVNLIGLSGGFRCVYISKGEPEGGIRRRDEMGK